LVFAGLVDSVVELHAMPGLAPAMEPRFKLDPPRAPRSLVEVVVSTAAPFIGVTVREARFRTRYQAAIIAVARHGARIHEKPGDIRLAPGDTLLLEASSSFLDLHRDAPEFFVVRQIDDPSVTPTKRAWASRGILGGMVAVVALELMTMFEAACLAGILMVGARCVRLSQARAAIDWTVIIGVAAGIGLGAALEETGAARLLATAAVHLLGDQPYANLLGVSVATMLLANLVTTKAAALLMYPVALAIAERLDVDFMPFAVALVISAACALATPVGYQTNLMVYGPGGYRGADFLRMGGALSMIVLSLLAWLVPAIWPFAPI
jgi:di/tricarboxylate transporter